MHTAYQWQMRYLLASAECFIDWLRDGVTAMAGHELFDWLNKAHLCDRRRELLQIAHFDFKSILWAAWSRKMNGAIWICKSIFRSQPSQNWINRFIYCKWTWMNKKKQHRHQQQLFDYIIIHFCVRLRGKRYTFFSLLLLSAAAVRIYTTANAFDRRDIFATIT